MIRDPQVQLLASRRKGAIGEKLAQRIAELSSHR